MKNDTTEDKTNLSKIQIPGKYIYIIIVKYFIFIIKIFLENFLKNKILLPSFYQPESKDLEEYTSKSIRNSLFLITMSKVI